MGYGRFDAKATNYKGVWFKSNLEARVAQAFNTLGIAWEYERQCFRDERFPYDQYTPDFHLPNTDAYVEVCGVMDERHTRNATVLCEIIGSTRSNPRFMVIDKDGCTRGYFVENGKLSFRCASWNTNTGKTDNLFDAAGMRRW